MPFGPAICASCGQQEGIEAHHLYSRQEGCPDDLTVWLCAVCHGRTHQHRRRLNICDLTRVGIEKKKARGECVGSVPYGFQLAADGKTLRPCEAEQETIRRAYALRRTGLALRGVATRLAGEGRLCRAGRTLQPNQIRRMLGLMPPIPAPPRPPKQLALLLPLPRPASRLKSLKEPRPLKEPRTAKPPRVQWCDPQTVPYGMRADPTGTFLVEDPFEQRVIARAAELRRRGLTLRMLSLLLEEEGMVSRSGRPFQPTQLLRMLGENDPWKQPLRVLDEVA